MLVSPYASVEAMRQCLQAIGAAEVGVLAISFSLALFSIQVTSQGSTFGTLRLYLADRSFALPFVALALIAVATFCFSLLPTYLTLFRFGVALALVGLGATCVILWNQFSVTAAHADPITAIDRWAASAEEAVREAGRTTPVSEELVRNLGRTRQELEQRIASTPTLENRVAHTIITSLEELMNITERLAVGSDTGRFGDAVRRITNLMFLIASVLQTGVRVEPRAALQPGSNLDPFMSEWLERLSRLYLQRLRAGDIVRARVVMDAFAQLVRSLQEFLS